MLDSTSIDPSAHVHVAFAARARQSPGAPAIDDGGVVLDAAQLDHRARGVASALRACGVRRGEFVALSAERSTEAIVGLLGILYAGAAYVPIAPDQPALRIRRILDDTGARVAVAAQRDLATFAAHEIVLIASDASEAVAADHGGQIVDVDDDDPVYAMYTSGSTGAPKGVVVTHRNLARYTSAILALLGDAERGRTFATTATLAADLGNTAVFPSLASGGCLAVVSYDDVLDGAAFQRRFEQRPADVLKTTPSHLRALLATAPDPRGVLPRETLICGGEALSWETVSAVRALDARCRIVNHYGPTETTVGALVYPVPQLDESDPIGTVPIGAPLPGVTAYVLDEEGRAVRGDTPGELYIGGDGVARGYLGRPEETAARFVPDPFASGAQPRRMYRTGDRARVLSDGIVTFLGRVDEQVKILGYRVEPDEIATILSTHPAIREAAVVARESGGSDPILEAYIVGDPVEVDDLRAFVAERLPPYMSPRTWTFLERLPRTESGKVDRAALAPETTAASRHERSTTNETQARVAAIWCELMGRDDLGPDDDFFELGGHSLLATIAVARLREAFGEAGLTLRMFFDAPTPAGVAAALDELRLATALDELEGLSDDEVRRLLDAAH